MTRNYTPSIYSLGNNYLLPFFEIDTDIPSQPQSTRLSSTSCRNPTRTRGLSLLATPSRTKSDLSVNSGDEDGTETMYYTASMTDSQTKMDINQLNTR